MHKDENLKKLQLELIYIALIFIGFTLLLKLVFYQTDFFTIFKTAAGLFWISVLPGFCVMYYWHLVLSFFERFVIGTAVGAAIVGIFSYYLGLIGIHAKYSLFILPVLMILTIIYPIMRDKKK